MKAVRGWVWIFSGIAQSYNETVHAARPARLLNQHPYKADTPTNFTVKPVLSAAYNLMGYFCKVRNFVDPTLL